MIVGLCGEIKHKTPTSLWIKNAGLTYEVFVPLPLLATHDQQIELYITQITREDGIFLYGFLALSEKTFFDRMIKINGIGPRIALAILSTYTSSEFMRLVSRQDVKALQKVPGLGAKMVNRILIELEGFCLDITQVPQKHFVEARMALESLGFKAEKVQQVLQDITGDDVSEIIKMALKQLSASK